MAYAYENLCQRILEAVGGTKNISSAFHCITRLRILVKDKSVVDFKTLNAIEDVIQVKEVGNQLQCVIGMHVPDVYKDFCAIAGISEQEAVDADEDDSALIEEAGPSKKRLLDGNPIMTLLNTIGEIMIPVLSGIIAGGMIKGVLALCTAFGWMAADSDLYTVLNAICHLRCAILLPAVSGGLLGGQGVQDSARVRHRRRRRSHVPDFFERRG